MAAVASLSANAQLAGFKAYIVITYYHIFDGYLVEIHRLHHSFSAVVHKCGGLHYQTSLACNDNIACKGLEFQLLYVKFIFCRQGIDSHKACVVAGVFILCPWVSQTYNDIFHGTCRLGSFVFVYLIENIENAHILNSP